LTFQLAANQQCVMISIVSDDVLENMEAFSVQLSTTDQSVELLTASTAIVSILDDDSEYRMLITQMYIYIMASMNKI